MRTNSTVRPLPHQAVPRFVFLGVLVALLAGASTVYAQGAAPEAPDRPTGAAVFVGGRRSGVERRVQAPTPTMFSCSGMVNGL